MNNDHLGVIALLRSNRLQPAWLLLAGLCLLTTLLASKFPEQDWISTAGDRLNVSQQDADIFRLVQQSRVAADTSISEHYFTDLQSQINGWLDLSDSAAGYEMRSLVYEAPHLYLIARWQDGQRVFPDQSSMQTFAESTLLTEALPAMKVLVGQLQEQNGRSSPVMSLPIFLSTGLADISCWQQGVAGVRNTLCVAIDAGHQAAKPIDEAMSWHWFARGIAAALLFGCFSWLSVALCKCRCDRATQTVLEQEQKSCWRRELMHDLRLSLANLLLYSSLACRRQADSQSDWQLVNKESQRMKRLVEELDAGLADDNARLADIGVETGANTDGSQWLSPQQQIKAMLVSCGPRLQQAGVDVHCDLQGDDRLFYPPESLNRILHNLLDNCARHAPGSRVSVSCQALQDQTLEIQLLCDFADGSLAGQRPDQTTEFLNNLPPWLQSWLACRVGSYYGTGLRSARRLAQQQGWGWACKLDASGFSASLTLPLDGRCDAPITGFLRV
ncbi:hypothetical protein [Oceanobacter mangrovi]|uniref:hypothetical protein n=1 Tax=Oceanobacter mangrovi TaxID=2862510 RepID=UPI001C8D78D6|nr:hypothetical protein [Oceanobacter mangrovi]